LALKNINISTTSDRDDPFISHQTLLQFGIDNQKIDLFKEDFKCKASVFGIYVHALNSFEMLYMFAQKLKRITKMYKDDLAIQTSLKNYKEFI
jgi:hypothetical protein